jgi:hypothetical protein
LVCQNQAVRAAGGLVRNLTACKERANQRGWTDQDPRLTKCIKKAEARFRRALPRSVGLTACPSCIRENENMMMVTDNSKKEVKALPDIFCQLGLERNARQCARRVLRCTIHAKGFVNGLVTCRIRDAKKAFLNESFDEDACADDEVSDFDKCVQKIRDRGGCASCAGDWYGPADTRPTVRQELRDLVANNSDMLYCSCFTKGEAVCNDDKDCTKDTCTPAGDCDQANDPAGNCPDDNKPCTEDRCEDGECKHPPRINGKTTLCDDDNECTIDACKDGACLHTPEAVTTECGDPCRGNACDGKGTCVEAADLDNGRSCNDGNRCTRDDVCNEGVCAGEKMPCPEDGDGNPCTIMVCDSNTGTCGAGKLNCDDDDPCTQDTCSATAIPPCLHVEEPNCRR